VAKAARAFAWSQRGELAFVGGDLLGFGGRSVALAGVQGVAWSPDGNRIAARASAAAGGTLWVVDPQSGAARQMAIATSDFAFAPDGALAALGPPPPKGGDRPLLRAPLAGGPPELLAADVSGFDLSRDGKRILVQQPHRGASRAVDLAVISADGAATGRVKPFVEEVDPTSRFADDGGKLVVYAIIAAAKGGVFLADVP
jgi:Lipoprotein LpqB beta-propeller domain